MKKSNDLNLGAGARNAMRVCMNVGPSDRVFILTDAETAGIAAALQNEARAVKAETLCIRLEEFGARPMTHLPDELAQKMTSFLPSVTFYAASIKENELGLRSGMISLALGKLGARHAHMPGITARIMGEGMVTDYNKIHNLTMRVYELVRGAQTIQVTSPDGTDLTASFDKKLKWIPCHGLYHKPGDIGNLPEGEVCTCPASIEGVLSGGVLGDYFSAKYGVLSKPLKIEIADSLVKKVSGGQKGIAAELTGYLDSAENGRRVGEFAIGTNIGITALRGVLLQDEKIPGVHIAFGDPLGNMTGAEWKSAIHVDVISPGCSIEVDGVRLMRDGQFTLPGGGIF